MPQAMHWHRRRHLEKFGEVAFHTMDGMARFSVATAPSAKKA